MKRLGTGLILAAMASAGCLTLPAMFTVEKKPPMIEIKPLPAPPSVTPDAVSEQNAADKAKALREEMEFEQRQRPGRDDE